MKYSVLKKTIFFTLFTLSIQISFAQNLLLSKEAKASVLTCVTSNEIYALFGHTAIRITDTINGIDVVYNYGAFDFSTSNFALKFVKGNLQYFAVANSYADFIANYTYEKRAVYEQVLNISAAQKQRLFDNLNQSLQLENREYIYKFIDQNCTSMAVDVINRSLNQKVIVKKGDTDKSYRTILYPYFDHHFYEQLGTSILFGTKTDQLGTTIFLPFELQKSLNQIKLNQLPIVKENKTVLEFEPEPNSSWWNNPYTYLLFLGLIVIVNKSSIDAIYLTIMAVLGLTFTLLGMYSTHLELANNYNILLFNPSLIALLYCAKANNKKGIKYLLWFNLMALASYTLIVINKAHLWIVAPLIITNGLILVRRFWNKQR
nr:DUF4105 domain-containing protein [Flavobacterium sp.]